MALAAVAFLPTPVQTDADKATIVALVGYFDFVDAKAGTILPEQIPAEDYKPLYVLDVRDFKRGAPNVASRLRLTHAGSRTGSATRREVDRLAGDRGTRRLGGWLADRADDRHGR